MTREIYNSRPTRHQSVSLRNALRIKGRLHHGEFGRDDDQGTEDDLVRRDERDLHRFGYAQELFRSMGGFSNFALSFSIISILTGAVTLYDYGLSMGGPAEMAFGWPLVALFTLAVAARTGELASAFPPPAACITGQARSAGVASGGSPLGSISLACLRLWPPSTTVVRYSLRPSSNCGPPPG